MTSLRRFHVAYHSNARRGYKDPNGNTLACSLVAGAFEKLTGGKSFRVRNIFDGELFPKQEPEREIAWGGHVVCIQDGFVYDVLLSGPCPFEDYLKETFKNADELVLEPLNICLADDAYINELDEKVLTKTMITTIPNKFIRIPVNFDEACKAAQPTEMTDAEVLQANAAAGGFKWLEDPSEGVYDNLP